MGKLGKVQECVLEELAKREQMSRVQLLCAVYGFRLSAGNVLSWGIAERRLLQAKEFTAATVLLKEVLEACKGIGFPDEVRPKRKRTDPHQRFNLVWPPPEIVVRHARREWRGGNAMARSIAQIQSISKFINSGKADFGSHSLGSAVTKGIIGELMNNPYPVEIPEELGEHPWHQLDQQLQRYMKEWRWKYWQRHSVERQHADDPSIALEKNEANVNIARALKSLENQGRISISGTRKEMKITLANAQMSLSEKRKNV